MAKPILTIGLPFGWSASELREAQERFKTAMPDYYVIFYDVLKSVPQFNVFYDKDFVEINYDELRDMLLSK